jgi:hypothetical protein
MNVFVMLQLHSADLSKNKQQDPVLTDKLKVKTLLFGDEIFYS